MEYISRSDEIILLAVLRLGEEATGVTIIRDVKNGLGKKLSLGGLWVSLDILAKKGLVTKRLGEPTSRRGGRRKLYYSLTSEGLEALKRIRELNKILWRAAPESIKGGC